MKHRLFLLLMTTWMCSQAGTAWAYRSLVKQTQPEASGARAITQGILLDDFSSGAAVNVWGGSTSAFTSSSGGNPTASITQVPNYNVDLNNVLGRSSFSLCLDYDVRTANSFAGYATGLLNQSLAGANYLSFWVKGNAGGEFFKIELMNGSATAGRNRAAVYVTDYLDGGVTTSWKKVVIPLDSFVNLDSFTGMQSLSVVFENAQALLNGSPRQGRLFIDNVIFGKTFLGYARIDHFGDQLGPDALGGAVGTFDSDGAGTAVDATITFNTTNFRTFANGLVSTYKVNPSGAFAGVFFIFGGGADSFTPIPHDFTPYRYVTLWAKARAANENPVSFKLELVSNAGATPFVVNGLSAAFQQIIVDMGNVASLENTLKQFNVVYERGQILAGGGDLTGAVVFDEIQIESDAFRANGPDQIPPPAPANLQDDGVAVSDGHAFGPLNTLTVTVAPDGTLEHARFEFSRDGVTWTTIGEDFDTTDTAFSVQWETRTLAVASDYRVRVVAHDASGNETVGPTFSNCQVTR